MLTVPDAQNEISSLASRWRLNDRLGASFVTDDIGAIDLFTVGSPLFSLPSLTKYDVQYTSVMGGAGSYFSLVGVGAYATANGITLEGSTIADPNGNSFSIISIPGQAQLNASGFDVIFNVWIGTTLHTLTASNALLGWPQQVVGVYDAIAGLQLICVDGAVVASQALSGIVGTSIALSTTGTTSTASLTITAIPTTFGMQIGGAVTGAAIPVNTQITAVPTSSSITISNLPSSSGTLKAITVGMPVRIAFPLTASTTEAAAQDVAVYGAPLSARRVLQHFQTFRQILSDPGHVRRYPQIGVYS